MIAKQRTITVSLTLIIVSFFAYLLIRFIVPGQIKPGDYITSVVDYGPVFTSVPATGVVNPENEVLLLSPASSIVSSIQLSPGSRVTKGTVILTLDPKSLTLDIENLRDQLGVMENDLQKTRLNARSTRVDLDYSAEVKNLKITSLKTEIADQEQLLKVGGISPALHEQTKQELVLAEKDLKMTLEKNSIRLKQIEADEKGLLLQIGIRNKELESREELLKRLTVRAPSDGIILGIFTNAGEKVEKDKLLARMSDLSSFKIKASLDNRYIDDIKTGGEVYANIENKRVKGRIGSITPVVKDNKIDFDVYLEGSSGNVLPNMEVELSVVTGQKDSVLRVEQGPAFSRLRHNEVYVVKNGKAVKKQVVTGLIGTDYVEIQSGLEPGDRIIISDVSPFRRKNEITLQEF
jgi:HlyD family secretion protein